MANGDRVATAAKAAGGSPTLRAAAVASSATSSAALVLVVLNKLSDQQLYELLIRYGGYFVIAMALLLTFYRVGSRGVSAVFRLANEARGIAEGMQSLSRSVGEIARKEDQRAVELDHTISIIAVRSEATEKQVKNMRGELGTVSTQVNEIHGMFERMANQYEKGREATR